MKTITCALFTLVTAGIMSGCGGGGGTAAITPIPPPPVVIAGVETPKSVSVVTAN